MQAEMLEIILMYDSDSVKLCQCLTYRHSSQGMNACLLF